MNIPFSGEPMSDPDYLAAWRVVVMPVLDCFQPDFIMVSAGFDAARGHSSALGGYVAFFTAVEYLEVGPNLIPNIVIVTISHV